MNQKFDLEEFKSSIADNILVLSAFTLSTSDIICDMAIRVHDVTYCPDSVISFKMYETNDLKSKEILSKLGKDIKTLNLSLYRKDGELMQSIYIDISNHKEKFCSLNLNWKDSINVASWEVIITGVKEKKV